MSIVGLDAAFTVGDSVPVFWVKFGANDLNCVDLPLNPTHSLTHSLTNGCYTVVTA